MKRTYNESNIIPAGTKVVFFADAGMAGTDTAAGFILVRDTTESELDEKAWRFGVDWAESYGIYPRSEYEDEDDFDEDDECYSDGIEGFWDIYYAEKHEGQITYGNEGPKFTDF